MDTEQQPAAAKNNSVPIIVAVVIVVGIAAGFGYMFMNKSGQNASKNTQATGQTASTPLTNGQPATPPPTGDVQKETPPPPPPSIGFYGKVMKRDGKNVTILQLLPPATAGGKLVEGKTYTVTAEENISYINQKKSTTTKPGEPPFTPSPGSLAGLNKGLFVYVETSDDIASKTTVKANQIMYSIESPF